MNTNTQRRGIEAQRERREDQKQKEHQFSRSAIFVFLCVFSAPLRLCGKFLALSAVLSLTLSQPAFAAKAKPATAEVAEKQGDLKDLRGQIESLRKEMAAAEGTRADVADQLKDAERDISITQRDLHQLGTQRAGLQTTLKELGAQSGDLENRLNSQQNQLERLIYRQYLQGNPDALHLLLNGDDPNQLARDLHYLAAIGRARSLLLNEIEATLQRKQALAADTRERAGQLAAIEERQKEQHGKLLAQREQRKATLEKVSARIAAQRREIGNLQRDEKRLSQLIERLAKIIAARPVPRPAAPRKPAAPATPGPESGPGERSQGKPVAEIANERTPEATPSGNFARLKGSLRLPAKGSVSNRFGTARQEGSTWKGLFIKAGTGSEVKAIAGGRVVFADWMRGFGNLLIVDHGDSYLTIYGNNDSLLKQVGDAVRGGDTVASVGNSGGNPESGLYFELRHLGQPLDPLKWVNVK
jgi:septal ring factor EnvC (AmiA/AmiB activator)